MCFGQIDVFDVPVISGLRKAHKRLGRGLFLDTWDFSSYLFGSRSSWSISHHVWLEVGRGTKFYGEW